MHKFNQGMKAGISVWKASLYYNKLGPIGFLVFILCPNKFLVSVYKNNYSKNANYDWQLKLNGINQNEYFEKKTCPKPAKKYRMVSIFDCCTLSFEWILLPYIEENGF